MGKTAKQVFGTWGEDQASVFLSQHGYRVVDRNFTITRNGKKAGEIDIIAWTGSANFGRTLCFIEVKTRSDNEGSAERATSRKQKMLAFLATARRYCFEKNINIDKTPIRFEQVSIYLNKKDGQAVFRKFEIPVD